MRHGRKTEGNSSDNNICSSTRNVTSKGTEAAAVSVVVVVVGEAETAASKTTIPTATAA